MSVDPLPRWLQCIWTHVARAGLKLNSENDPTVIWCSTTKPRINIWACIHTTQHWCHCTRVLPLEKDMLQSLLIPNTFNLAREPATLSHCSPHCWSCCQFGHASSKLTPSCWSQDSHQASKRTSYMQSLTRRSAFQRAATTLTHTLTSASIVKYPGCLHADGDKLYGCSPNSWVNVLSKGLGWCNFFGLFWHASMPYGPRSKTYHRKCEFPSILERHHSQSNLCPLTHLCPISCIPTIPLPNSDDLTTYPPSGHTKAKLLLKTHQRSFLACRLPHSSMSQPVCVQISMPCCPVVWNLIALSSLWRIHGHVFAQSL